MTERRRASTVSEYYDLQKRLWTPTPGASKPSSEPFNVRSSDVFITPFSKSGTTWLQQIFHTLRTRGDTNFEDISAVVPWLEVSPMLGIDLNAEQRAHPRGYKSHAQRADLPRGAKYIVSVRHPADVAYSLFKFMEGWFIEPNTISLDEFVREVFLPGAYFDHLLSWWPHRLDDDVLFLTYEHMSDDLSATITRIAQFCNIPIDESLLNLTLERASFAFMQHHKTKFDDALLRAKTEESVLPHGSDSAKVRTGQVGDRARLSDTLRADIQAQWATKITPKLGLEQYDTLLKAVYR